MPEEIDWSLTTFAGVRLRHMRAFHALPLREKIRQIERMNEVAERLRPQPRAPQPPLNSPSSDDATPHAH